MVGGYFPGLPSPVQFPEKGKSCPQVFRGIATQGSGPHRSMGQVVICPVNKERKQDSAAMLPPLIWCQWGQLSQVTEDSGLSFSVCVKQLPCKLAAGPWSRMGFEHWGLAFFP